MAIVKTSDKHLLTKALTTDPVAGLYLLGDLSDYYFPKCEWYIETDPAREPSVELLYRTWGTTLIPFGSSESLEEFLREHISELPGEIYAAWLPVHDDFMQAYFDIPEAKSMQRMTVTDSTFAPSSADSNQVEVLGIEHLSEVVELLKSYPENFFEEYQLSTGFYRGIRIDGYLASMAGVHTTNPGAGVAAIGNVVTRQDHRGKGLAQIVTSSLVQSLLESHELVGLNVGVHNVSAVKAYERLGFQTAFRFFEGFCYRR